MEKRMDLSFLLDVKLEAVKKVAPKGRVIAPKLPENADLRLFANGRIYPSKAFAELANLEFMPKIPATPKDGEEASDECTVVVGNGLEIFSSKDWGMIKGQLPQELIFCAPVPKTLPKVDMWASTKYDDDNNPKASVFTQGANTFARERLVPMVADIYGINWEETEYVDFKVVADSVMVSPNNLYHLPKIVSTGKDKGKADYIRRENLTVCPLIIEAVKLKDQELAVSPGDVATVNDSEDLQDGTMKAEHPISEEASSDTDWTKGLGANADN